MGHLPLDCQGQRKPAHNYNSNCAQDTTKTWNWCVSVDNELAAARMRHRGMVHCAADAAAARMICVALGSALRPRCKCKWNAHAQWQCMCTCILYVHGTYVVAVGVIKHELVVTCSACARALKLWVDVIKRRKRVCTYAWVRHRYGI